MSEWFQCKKCWQIFHRELITANRCPFCGHDYLSEVILKERDISPTYTYYARPFEGSFIGRMPTIVPASKEGEI